MGNDSKFGVMIGLALVLLVAVTYYSKDGKPAGGGAASVVPSLPSPGGR